jgi:peptidoglycan/xylan/chitin deacetylase (PgdA/CDA1 family)
LIVLAITVLITNLAASIADRTPAATTGAGPVPTSRLDRRQTLPTVAPATAVAILFPNLAVPSPMPVRTPTATLLPHRPAPPAAGLAAASLPIPADSAPLSVPPAESPAEPIAAQPEPTPDGVPRQVRVPILMYHYVSWPPANADRYRRDLSVAPEQLAEHLAYLQGQGYQGITFYDLLNHLAWGQPLPDRPIILTFDDGYRDNYDNAFPLLRQYGFPATFFVLTEVTSQGVPDYMTWDQLREMAAAGMDIECHSRVHDDLPKISYDRLVWQVLGCREMIEAELGQRPRFVAYPSGQFNEEVAAVFASDHYWGGITTQQGAWHSSDNLFALQRLRVRNTTGVEHLAKLLAYGE